MKYGVRVTNIRKHNFRISEVGTESSRSKRICDDGLYAVSDRLSVTLDKVTPTPLQRFIFYLLFGEMKILFIISKNLF